ncbi:MAG: CsgG/HfaB family protein [Fibrobacterales bacterium]
MTILKYVVWVLFLLQPTIALSNSLPNDSTSNVDSPIEGSDRKKNYAILTFTSTGAVTLDDAQSITDRFQSELHKLNTLVLIERNQINLILEEQGFQTSGACDTKGCHVEVGQLLGVDYIITASIGKVGDLYTISLKIIDVETGIIKSHFSDDMRGTVENVLLTGCKRLAYMVVNGREPENDVTIPVWTWVASGVAIVGGVIVYILLNNEPEQQEVHYY